MAPPRRPRRMAHEKKSPPSAPSNDAMDCLECEVRALTRTTAQLEGQVETLRATLLRFPQWRSDTATRLCKEYWLMFRQGYAIHDPLLAAKQTAMCHAVMCQDVAVWNHGVGPTGILTQWKRWVSLFHNIHRDLHSIDVVHCEPTCIVRTHGTIHLHVSRSTIEQLFPHILANEALVQQVIGIVLAAPLQVDYIMDTSCHRIQVVTGHIDLTQAFHAVLGSLTVTNTILAHSRVQSSGEIPAMARLETSRPATE
ncbi:hypothetical protein H310_13028 [Aphanomyces invadans]|uniref:Bzip transcription factor n=1 Tax=Aphanomyces invadans TaxID=157072 RepID=A0A024TGW5_9STRA|nr:hypothetical protein H310_13028 [Aphanomyces invadans]ETV92821.1 hypothetical protein H310_13028 [Aphanomyces invadans]|eukprot:XP_008878591.1 hypothetical protein H310_13028 [Aphanomyces invadans]